MKKPPNLLYGLDEQPPLAVTALNGVQHVAVIAVYLLYPLLVFRAIGAPALLTANLLAIAMLVLGLGTFLQAMRIGPIGSGYMCPAVFTAVYLAPSLAAAHTGGLALVFGMTAFAGAVEAAIAPALQRLRAIFPPELSGLVLFVIGLSAAMAAVRAFLGAGVAPVTLPEWAVAGVTLLTMIVLNIWGATIARMLCTLLGVMAGYVAAAFAGLLSSDFTPTLNQISWIGVPSFDHMAWSFDPAFALPFAIGSMAAAIKAAGTITLAHRANDSDWVRTDMRPVVRGVLADGASTFLAGVLGSIGTNTATGSAALAAATGVTSRVVAFAVGGIFVLLAFFPKLSGLLAVMPRAVIVGSLLFVNSFIMVNGLQIMTSRLLDARRTLMIALTIVGATTIELFPGLAATAPKALAWFLGSSLVFATVLGLTLNFLFRIGIKKSVSLTIDRPDGAYQQVDDFFMKHGAAWGARPDTVKRVVFAVVQLIELVDEDFRKEGPMTVTATFDEYNFDVRLTYKGEVPEFPERRPTDQEIRAGEAGMRRLAGFMLRRNADRVRSASAGNMATVHFHFDH